ncbi:MAG: AAA family ATPase [bacterium]|nr:AAA family ATPase [bacterium]
MPKSTTIYACTKCDAQTPKWLGQCAECGAWGTMTAAGPSHARTAAMAGIAVPEIPTLASVTGAHAQHHPTGIGEFDLAIGGGFIPGALLLLAGEPGIGKSTLILQVAGAVAAAAHGHSTSSRGGAGGGDVLYITGEETAAQLKHRADRLGIATEHIRILATPDAAVAAAAIAKLRPALAIVDSVQTLSLPDVPTGAGGVTQVRAVTSAILAAAKGADIPTVIIGHVTKDGTVAGPKTLEHLVDQVAVFEGEAHSDLRILRTTKNRYGATDVAGVFTMTERGLAPCADPASAFLTGTGASPGSAVAAIGLGTRTLMVEIQALVTRTSFGQPQRRTVGFDCNRLHVLLAILAQHGGVSLASSDVHAATASGMRIDDPLADLAMAGALLSASAGVTLPFDALIGELGLDGTVRTGRGAERRIQDAARIGRTRIAIPPGAKASRGTITVNHIRDLVQALTRNLRRET